MGDYRRSNCRDCGASGNDTHISRSGLCPECGIRRLLTSHAEIRTGSGTAYSRWRVGMQNAHAPIGRPPTPYDPDA